MRVLFVSQEFPPETGWGGIGTYVAMVSRALAAAGVEVHVLSVVEGQRESAHEIDGVVVHRFPLPGVRGPSRQLPEAWSRFWLSVVVARLVGKLRPAPDVVECPDWKAEGFTLALRGAVPLVVRLHSTARQLFPYSGQGQHSFGLDGRFAAWLEEVAVKRANLVLSTRSNFAEISGRLGLDETAAYFIPHIVRFPPQSAYPRSAESPRVTFVGRLEPRKAPQVLLRAAPRVLAAVPGARFVFIGRTVGDPAAPSSAESLGTEAQRLGIGDAVELPGGLDWQGVADELRRASVCVFPSRWECFPNVAGEASAIGRPVVVSSIPGFQELVRDGITGVMVRGDDAESWAGAIAGLLLDRERARVLGEAGSRLVRQISDPDRIASQTILAYEHAIDRWRQGRKAGSGRGHQALLGRGARH